MENKELKITPPAGYVIDKENSTFECIKFRPKGLSYKNVVKEILNKESKCYYLTCDGAIFTNYNNAFTSNISNNSSVVAHSKKQLEKLLAINKLMNVGKYLNGDWKPDWDDYNEDKYYISIQENIICVIGVAYTCTNNIYFKSEKLAWQAIDILGEDTIRLAFSTDW